MKTCPRRVGEKSCRIHSVQLKQAPFVQLKVTLCAQTRDSCKVLFHSSLNYIEHFPHCSV